MSDTQGTGGHGTGGQGTGRQDDGRHGDGRPRANVVVRAAVALSAWSVRNRVLVIGLCVVIALAGAAGALRLTFNPDARVYFSTTAKERLALEAIVQRYGARRDVIAIVRGEPARART